MNHTMNAGTRQYEAVQSWAKLPENMQFGYTHGIVTDRDDNVYVFHTGKPSVVIFDKHGRYLASWGDEFEGGAHGFYLHREGGAEFLYATDTRRGMVAKVTLDGNRLLEIGTPARPDIYDDQRRFIPTDVAVAPGGDIYISDGYGQSWVHQYTAEGEYIRSWGGAGAEPGQLKCPHGISVDLRGTEPEIYVADRGNNRIQMFTPDGRFKRLIRDDMRLPCSFFFHGDEMLFPDLHSRVTIFDGNDRLIAHLGDDPEAHLQEGWPNLPKAYFRPDKFSSPHGVCVDSEGSVYVAEWIRDGRVTKLIRTK